MRRLALAIALPLVGGCASFTWTQKSADGGTLRLNDDSAKTRQKALDEIERFCGGKYALERETSSAHRTDEANANAEARSSELAGNPARPKTAAGPTTSRVLVFSCVPK